MRPIRQSPYALRFFQRSDGLGAVVYQRRATRNGHDRLARVAAIGSLAVQAGSSLLRAAVHDCAPSSAAFPAPLAPGPCRPLNAEWGPRVACYAIVAAGLRDAERLMRSAAHFRAANPDEAAWWLGLLLQPDNVRALRALRILTEAVE